MLLISSILVRLDTNWDRYYGSNTTFFINYLSLLLDMTKNSNYKKFKKKQIICKLHHFINYSLPKKLKNLKFILLGL